MTRTVGITFDPRFVEPILNGSKTATLRYEWDKPLRPGDNLRMDTPDGNTFAVSTAGSVTQLTALDAAAMDIDGHENYDDVDHVARVLGRYYPTATIGPKTNLTLIRYPPAKDVDHMLRWELPQGVSR